jgi:hypothetical protein
VSDFRTYASEVPVNPSPSEMLGRRIAEPDVLRTRAARYRLLAETLLDPRVIAVVRACARDLETEAVLTGAADDV